MTQSRSSLPRTQRPAQLTLGQAVALGALHGPAEALPISSSGHTTAIPWLLGSAYAELDPQLRKALEVSLHAGSALGLLIGSAPQLRRAIRLLDPHQLLVIGAATLPASAAGLVLERRIEATCGTPTAIAAGLLAGSLAMVLADRAPETRRASGAEIRDGVWLGLAQATALIPGVSRGGATMAAARWRRFRRQDAHLLSAELAWPVIAGASLLKAWRLRQTGLREHVPPLLVGGAASALSTILATRRRQQSSPGSPLSYALYRSGLAAAIVLRLSLGRRAHDQGDTRAA